VNHKYPLVMFRWDDAASGAGWFDSETTELKPQLVITIGFVVKESEKYVCLAHSYCPASTNCIGEFQIPKQMIVSRKTLIRAKKA
jgi:hypothetical protein